MTESVSCERIEAAERPIACRGHGIPPILATVAAVLRSNASTDWDWNRGGCIFDDLQDPGDLSMDALRATVDIDQMQREGGV